MIKQVTFMLTILLTANVAYADSQLERMEVLSEELSQLMYDAMIDEVAAEGVDVSNLKKLVPDVGWDGPMRDAAKCVLGKYEDKIGSKGIDEMLDKLEGILPELRKGGGMQALEAMPDIQPKGISDEEAIALNQECGMVDQMQKNMMADGFMTELMKAMSGS
ncbi:MAG: hypothetical protein AAGJ37_16485 [Pseudomonadota bacterium]